MKLRVGLISLLVLSMMVLGACGKANSGKEATIHESVTIKLGIVDLPPYGDIVNLVKENLKKEGIHLEIKAFTDVTIPNQALNNKEIDLNYFQSLSYLEQFNVSNGMDLVPIADTFTGIFGLYSKKYVSMDEVPDGSTITIPADPGNSGRSLALLHEHGLIKLKDGVGVHGSQQDIVENEKKYKIVEVDQMLLPQAYNDSDLTAMMGTYALQAKLVPSKDTLIRENNIHGSDFFVVLTARKDNQNDVNIQKVAKAFQSTDVKTLIEKDYSDAFTWKKE
ncbi:MetQ/NlpA family ABC transporter substrate-binding protein [Paenibacillus sp. JCM 10914]|uniref:MetQ/NlpA family ABC transporter substrate-binding protein n=1 Tax=Paenibacillus sp. JCM 10914 TaxID=1236974 RepID=UPI0003CC3DD8|nr:MetQ/NlpA family ABC transporter substrate-binding protein [Paenibacillus sp. JCM 10914]GAE08066.1 methionine ABC transporter substrate-binding protein [Paenibacillus sp. JCM 10914]